ncbi:MAG: flagellar motor switch protein FliG [Proteobacteria bacterium]|nr:flagellar motor switch protein FliG [Pseudomonadota bacterium]
MNLDTNDAKKTTGIQKTAIFLMAMGEEFTASFFKTIDQNNIKKIGKYMSKITYIPADVLNAVMKDFLTNFQSDKAIGLSGKSFLKQVADKSMGESPVKEVVKAIERENENTPFAELAYLPAENIINLFKGEHPQTISLVLSTLPQDKAAEILCMLPDENKADIAYRILHIGEVNDDVIRDLDEILKKEITEMGAGSKRKFDGVEALANILSEVNGETEESIMMHIEKEDIELAQKIRQKMFLFEDLLKIDDKSFREILKNISNDVFVRALKTASEEMKEKIFSNLSERAANMLKEDFEVLGPIRIKEVEDNQQEIIKAAKKLEAEGKIVIGGKGKDDVFV